MSLLKTIRAQLGISATATQNFTLDASASDGTMKLARGNAGATTQDILTVDASGNVNAPVGINKAGSVLQALSDFTGTNVSLASSGYQKLPSGLIIQWGISANVSDDQRITTTFPITFPNNCFVVVPASGASAVGRSSFAEVHSISWTTSSVVFENLCNAGITTQARWLAIGY